MCLLVNYTWKVICLLHARTHTHIHAQLFANCHCPILWLEGLFVCAAFTLLSLLTAFTFKASKAADIMMNLSGERLIALSLLFSEKHHQFITTGWLICACMGEPVCSCSVQKVATPPCNNLLGNKKLRKVFVRKFFTQ